MSTEVAFNCQVLLQSMCYKLSVSFPDCAITEAIGPKTDFSLRQTLTSSGVHYDTYLERVLGSPSITTNLLVTTNWILVGKSQPSPAATAASVLIPTDRMSQAAVRKGSRLSRM